MLKRRSERRISLLFAVIALLLVQQVLAALPTCPAESALKSQGGNDAAKVTLHARSEVDADLMWIDFNGREQLTGMVRGFSTDVPYSDVMMNSFEGHAWRLRSQRTGAVLGETVIPAVTKQEQSQHSFAAVACQEDTDLGEVLSEDWPMTETRRTELKECHLENALSSVPSPGFHVMCILREGTAVRIVAFKDGLKSSVARSWLVNEQDLPSADPLNGLSRFIQSVAINLKLPRRKPSFQPSALFTADGQRADGVEGLSVVYYFEGGQWLWPAVEKGFTRAIGDLRTPGEATILTTLSLQPRVFEIKNFLKPEESEEIIRRATPHMMKSDVALKDADKGKAATEWRTSATHFLSANGDPSLQRVEKRVTTMSRVPIGHTEDTQVLRYELTEHYHAHHDFFDPRDYANSPQWSQLVAGGARNRMATVFFYLTDVEEGGETIFPLAAPRDEQQHVDYSKCDAGLKVRPEANKVILFYNLFPNGEMDQRSLHGGCDVEMGTKWSANFWIWNQPVSFTQRVLLPEIWGGGKEEL